MTLQMLLRRNFGFRHIDTRPAKGNVYHESDLKRDAHLNPFLNSVAGHGMRPYVDLGEAGGRLRWYSVMREPVARCISHYQHQVEKKQLSVPLEEWLRRPENVNWHVRMYAGEQNLPRAKEMLEKMKCVGLMEKFDEFLLLARHRLGWRGFDVAYTSIKNPATFGGVRKRITENDKYWPLLNEVNALDLQLYDYAKSFIYTRQVEEYGLEKLKGELVTEFANPRAKLMHAWRLVEAVAFRRLYYLPAVSALIRLDNT